MWQLQKPTEISSQLWFYSYTQYMIETKTGRRLEGGQLDPIANTGISKVVDYDFYFTWMGQVYCR